MHVCIACASRSSKLVNEDDAMMQCDVPRGKRVGSKLEHWTGF